MQVDSLGALLLQAVTDSVRAAMRDDAGWLDWLGAWGSVASLVGLGVSFLTLYLVRDLQGRHAMRIRLPDLAARLAGTTDDYDQSVLGWIRSQKPEDLDGVLDQLALLRQLTADVSRRSQGQLKQQADTLLGTADQAKIGTDPTLFQEVRRESRMLVMATENYLKDEEARL